MSNFWKEFSFPSPVDDILKKPHFTLEELLDEDDVVVDIRSQKEELKDFLTKSENLSALLQYIVQEPPAGASEAVQFRYPVVACEILTAEVDEIERELVNNQDLLSLLFGFFANEKVNVLLANLVIRTIGSLMNTRLPSLLDYLKAKPEFLEHIVSHIYCAAVPEFIIRLVNVEAEYEGKGTLQWLVEQDFARTMVSKFSPEHERLQSDLARTLIEIIVTSSESSPLLQKLYAEDTLDLLLEQILKPGNTYGFRAGMAVVSQLLRALGNQMHDSDMSGNIPVPHDAPLEGLPLVVRKVVAVLPKLKELLVAPPKTRVITNQTGKDVEAFGFYRLAILQCFECLLSLGYSNLLKDLLLSHSEIYRHFFELIFKFSTNNFCPIFVERIFATSLAQAANDDVIEFVKALDLPNLILQKEQEVKDTGFMAMPFFRRIIYNLTDRQRRTDQLEIWLSGVAGWEDLINSLADEFAEMDHRTGYGDMGSDSHSNEQMSLSDESVESSNDADDYDTLRAEVLLSKASIDAMF